jgi:hypothetical protein
MSKISNGRIPYESNYIRTSKKSNNHISAYLPFFLIFILSGNFVLMAAEPNENTSRKEVEYFLKKYNEKHVTQLVVYYMSLNELTRTAVTESSLRDNYYEYKVIAVDPNLSEISKSLRGFKFERINRQSFDLRWGCVFYAGNEEILRLFFPSGPMVALNGVGYKSTPELMKAIMQFLPVEAYKEMNEYDKKWGLFKPIPPKQKEMPKEQKKSDEPHN